MFAPRTVVVSLAGRRRSSRSLAGLAPAIRATRVPPIAAVREGATLPRARSPARRRTSRAVIVALALALLGYGAASSTASATARAAARRSCVGMLALFVGVALVSSRLVQPLARVLGLAGRPVRRRGGPARAGEARAQPRPHGGDRGRADDRARARHLRGRDGQGPRERSTRTRSTRQIDADYVVDVAERLVDARRPTPATRSRRRRGVEASSSVRARPAASRARRKSTSPASTRARSPASTASSGPTGSDATLADARRRRRDRATTFADEQGLARRRRGSGCVTPPAKRRRPPRRRDLRAAAFDPLLGERRRLAADVRRGLRAAEDTYTFVNGRRRRAQATLERALSPRTRTRRC